MRSYFEIASESQPNRYNQRHLRQAAVTKESIHSEYSRDMDLRCDSHGTLTYRHFCKAWLEAFPNVRIQKFVSVQTKCNTCADLDALAQNCGDNKAFCANFEISEVIIQCFTSHSESGTMMFEKWRYKIQVVIFLVLGTVWHNHTMCFLHMVHQVEGLRRQLLIHTSKVSSHMVLDLQSSDLSEMLEKELILPFMVG